jgi:hypothetical protein
LAAGFIAALMVAAPACGSSSGGTGGAAGTGGGAGSTGTKGTGGAKGAGGSSGTGGAAGVGGAKNEGGADVVVPMESSTKEGGGDGGCASNCVKANMAGYIQFFEDDELQSCACAAMTTPCNSMCVSECATPSTLTASSPCGVCLKDQAGMGSASACSATATTTCMGQSSCAAFLTCVQGC